jgi:hypothetical protein
VRPPGRMKKRTSPRSISGSGVATCVATSTRAVEPVMKKRRRVNADKRTTKRWPALRRRPLDAVIPAEVDGTTMTRTGARAGAGVEALMAPGPKAFGRLIRKAKFPERFRAPNNVTKYDGEVNPSV